MFARHLRSFAAALDLEEELRGLDSSAAFVRLESLCDKTDLAVRVKAHANGALAGLRLQLKDKRLDRTSSDLSEEVTAFVFHNLIAAMAHRYVSDVPRKHHWLPVTYLARFGTKAQKGRGVVVNEISYKRDAAGLHSRVGDGAFAHGTRWDGNGFYHLSIENFFGRMESESAITMSATCGDGNRAYEFVVQMAFFVVQAVRNPVPGTHKFSLSSIEGIVNALEQRLALEPRTFLSTVKVQRAVFTPYAPARRVRIDQATVQYFPLGARWALLASDVPLSVAEAERAAAMGVRGTVKHAQRTGGVIYGVEHDHLRRMGL